MYGQGIICIPRDGEARPAYRRTGKIFFPISPQLSLMTLLTGNKIQSLINLQKEHVSSAYSISPYVLCFTPCHHLPSMHHGCLSDCMTEKAPRHGTSFCGPGFFFFSPKLNVNYSLMTKFESLEL